ncbi:MAG: alpha/beta fold hydrolase [Ktedonobacteraceae bacterium]
MEMEASRRLLCTSCHLRAYHPYQVVTYDRRGFSRSHLEGSQDYDHRLSADTDDVRRLIEHLTDKPATVFGNSSGAIVALEVLIHAPDQVQTVAAQLLPYTPECYGVTTPVQDLSRDPKKLISLLLFTYSS